MDAVGRRLTALSLPGVRLRRKMMDLEAARRGDENVATPRELRRLMEAVREGVELTPARAADLRLVAGTAGVVLELSRCPPRRNEGAHQVGRARGRALRGRLRGPARPALLGGHHDEVPAAGRATATPSSARSRPSSTTPSTGWRGPASTGASSANARPRCSQAEVLEGLPSSNQAEPAPVLDQDLGGARPHVVVRRHDEAVGARVAHREQVARLEARELAAAGQEVAALADRAHDVGDHRGARARLRPARSGDAPGRGPAAAGRSCPRPRSRSASRRFA